MKDKKYVIDQCFDFKRRDGYIPFEHLTIEGEIKAQCKKNRIAVQSIERYDGYYVYGRKTRSHKECQELQEALDKASKCNSVNKIKLK